MRANTVSGRTLLALLVVAVLASVGCGGAAQIGSSGANVQQMGHVFLVVEENHSYSEVIGSSSMPYLNSLASNYGLATQYYANLHPSISDYFMLTTGQPITLNDAFTGTVTQDNIVRELNAAGKSWKSYAESLPQTGYTGGDVSLYMKHHNPFVYFSDVVQSPAQLNNVVPFTQFSTDLAGGKLPNFSFIVPNIMDDAHTGTLNQADNWLQQNIAPLISSSTFQQDGLLIITFDEGDITDVAYGGGHVATVVIGGKSKKKVQSSTVYQHQNTLRTILQTLGVTKYPGAAGAAPAMTDLF